MTRINYLCGPFNHIIVPVDAILVTCLDSILATQSMLVTLTYVFIDET